MLSERTAWRTIHLENGATKCTYKLDEVVPEEGAEFHTVTRSVGGVLVRHTTALYTLTEIQCALVAAKLTHSGRDLVMRESTSACELSEWESEWE